MASSASMDSLVSWYRQITDSHVDSPSLTTATATTTDHVPLSLASSLPSSPSLWWYNLMTYDPMSAPLSYRVLLATLVITWVMVMVITWKVARRCCGCRAPNVWLLDVATHTPPKDWQVPFELFMKTAEFSFNMDKVHGTWNITAICHDGDTHANADDDRLH
jgi:hypothetical protein